MGRWYWEELHIGAELDDVGFHRENGEGQDLTIGAILRQTFGTSRRFVNSGNAAG